MLIFQDLEKETNVHIEWENIPDTDYQTKKNLLLASGDLPDAFYNSGFSDLDIVNYGEGGTIIPLEDLIDEHAPNLKKILEKRPEIKQLMTAPDGHIYSLPRAEEMGLGAVPFFVSINKTWLDNLGLEIPQTTEQFYAVLKAFKNGDPNGNGKADEVPFSFMSDEWCMDIADFFGSFGMPDNIDHKTVRDGKVVYTATHDAYKEGIEWFREMYAEGLIDPESFTQDAKQYLAKGKTEESTLDDLQRVYAPYMDNQIYPMIFFTPLELEEIRAKETDINNYIKQMKAKWIVRGGVETEWDEYIQTLDKMGLQDLMRIWQEGLDRFNQVK